MGAAQKSADAANKAKSDFLAAMSHEIRTPLSGVYGAAQILHQRIRAANNSDLVELTDILVDSADNLMALINDILDLSKIEAGQIDINPATEDLRAVPTNLQKSVQHMITEKDLDLRLVIDRTLPGTLVFDRVRVRQCISNLVANAIKFTAAGSVTIAAKYEGGDTGIGMSQSDRDGLFDQFTQAGPDTEKTYGGTGLGLFIPRKLSRLMGGDITVASQPGRGSIFTLTFACEGVVDTDRFQTAS